MKKLIRVTLSTIFALFILAACTGDNGANDVFTIGVIPAQTEGEMDVAMDKLQRTLTVELGREVTVDVYPDYNGVVEAMNFNKIDMAFLGPLTYVVANAKSGAQAILTQLIDGEPFYHAYIITHTDNHWDSLDQLLVDVNDVNFAFGDQNSTSGSLIPSIELQDRGVFISGDDHQFNSARFTGSHDATALSVQNKQVDAGAIDSVIYNQMVASGRIDEDQVKVIWESVEFFQYPWAVSQDTAQETITELQAIFLGIDDQDILTAFGASGFVEATDEDYQSIKEAAIIQGIIEE